MISKLPVQLKQEFESTMQYQKEVTARVPPAHVERSSAIKHQSNNACLRAIYALYAFYA